MLFSDAARPTPPARRGWIGPTVLFSGIAVVVALGVAPAPYVIEQPGPVYDTLGTSTREGEEVPLIVIPDEPTYPTGGSLDMLTVSVVGNPEQLPNWLEIVGAWFDRSKAVVPVTEIFPSSTTTEQRDEFNQAEMTSSQQEAIAAALTRLGYPVGRRVDVAQVIDGSPATGILEPGDRIVAVDGTEVADVDALRAAVAANGTAEPVTLSIVRDSVASEVEVTPVESDDAVVIGIGAGVSFDFPFEVDIQLDDVGGPSAGMMFALGITDKLTEGELNGGEEVAGTGTIDADGEVGPIGGIRQKLFGAVRSGADWFLAPSGNCDMVVGHVPDGLSVLSVATLDDAMAALEGIASGDTADLPTCDSATPIDG